MTCPHLHVAAIEGWICLNCGAVSTCKYCGLPAMDGCEECPACYEPDHEWLMDEGEVYDG